MVTKSKAEQLADLQSVERSGKTVQASRKRQHGRAQSATHQVGGVRTDVSTLMVRVDSEVQAHQLDKVVVVAVTELVGQVEAVVLILLDGAKLAILEDVSVDLGRDGRQFGDNVHAVLESILPVFLLVDALGVGFGEGRLVLQGGNGQRELGHGVEVRRAAVNELRDELGDVGPRSPVCGEFTDLLLGGHLASQK